MAAVDGLSARIFLSPAMFVIILKKSRRQSHRAVSNRKGKKKWEIRDKNGEGRVAESEEKGKGKENRVQDREVMRKKDWRERDRILKDQTSTAVYLF
jgi:hypothetical protein